MTETSIRQEGELYDLSMSYEEATEKALQKFTQDYPDAAIESFCLWWDNEDSLYEYKIKATE